MNSPDPNPTAPATTERCTCLVSHVDAAVVTQDEADLSHRLWDTVRTVRGENEAHGRASGETVRAYVTAFNALETVVPDQARRSWLGARHRAVVQS